ncbi:MAG: hypothetical protein JWN14_3867, partial [Chthonomonadales bacterium]|nr:hypothetical protein [Chthonomonadales bacterium]
STALSADTDATPFALKPLYRRPGAESSVTKCSSVGTLASYRGSDQGRFSPVGAIPI